MPKTSIKKIIALSAFLPVTTLISYHIFSEYQRSIAPSTFEIAASELGFNGSIQGERNITKEAQQEAVLKIFQVAGYLKPEKLWEDLHRMGSVPNPAQVFKDGIYPAIMRSNAQSEDPKDFNAKSLRKNFCKEMSATQCEELLSYLSQHAFRKAGQERNELKAQNWMIVHQDYYKELATTLGLIDRIEPTANKYDEAWIAGASRLGVLLRALDLKNTIANKNLEIKGAISVLAGQRELWAEIDGINPTFHKMLLEAYNSGKNLDKVDISVSNDNDSKKVEEGKKYLESLAKKSAIQFNPGEKFVYHITKEECEPGHFPNRTYANTSKKLTETFMTKDVLQEVFGAPLNVVDTKLDNHARPTTASTARDAGERIIREILEGKYGDQKKFTILLESNQPYALRQALTIQNEINKLLEAKNLKGAIEIKIEGVGAACKQGVEVIHAELGPLVTEKLKAAHGSNYPVNHLLFQTRDNTAEAPQYPHDELENVVLHGGFIKNLFDDWLD